MDQKNKKGNNKEKSKVLKHLQNTTKLAKMNIVRYLNIERERVKMEQRAYWKRQ